MADATLNPGLFSTNQTTEVERLVARKHFKAERRLSAEEARELWTFGGDAEALALFRALSPAEQAAKKAAFLQQAEELELQSWLESIDQGGWASAGEIETQLMLDELEEDAAKAEDAEKYFATMHQADAQQAKAELDPAWVKLMEQSAAKEAKLAQARKTSKAARRRAMKAQARSNSEPKVAMPVVTPATPPVEAPAEAKLEAAEKMAAEQFQAKRQANAKRYGMACSHCGYGLTQRNRWVPPIDEMKADLGRDVEISDLESFVVCGRCADEADYPLANTQRVLTARDQRRAQAVERQRVIEAELKARAEREAADKQAKAQEKKRREMLLLKSRGRFTHGNGIRNADARR